MLAKPQIEHELLDRLIGNWTVESECQMAADKPLEKSEYKATCRSIGGLWVVLESKGEMPEQGPWSSIMTLGYDPKKSQYVGTFVASVMPHLWLYQGTVSESRTKLTLDTEGPRCDQDGMARYQDMIQFIDDDSWVLSSQILNDDGKWHAFMSGRHTRIK